MKTITIIADAISGIGVVVFLAGLYSIWTPLPLVVGGLGAITLGIMLDRSSRK